MRINRGRSTLTFRRQRRRLNCLPLTLLVGLVIVLVFISWEWLEEQLTAFLPTPGPSADLNAAERAFGSGDLQATIDQARQIWQRTPTNIDALNLLTQALIYRSYDDYDQTNDRTLALTYTTEAYERLASNPVVMAIHAYALQATGESIEAARIANQALSLQSNLPLAHITLSLAYNNVGGHAQALQQADLALAIEESVEAYRARALALGNLGRYEDALTAVNAALTANNRLLALHFERAAYAMNIGDADTATASYFSVLAFDADNAKANLRMCELSSTLRESDTALTYCQQASELAPTWADAWLTLGQEHYLRGEFAAAQAALNRCSTLQTIQGVPAEARYFDCWYLQGQSAEILGNCDALTTVYAEYQQMARAANLPQTWTYPPEGPAICTAPAGVTDR
jgi:tetratricopeptide (TPR) repeat protein